MRVTRMATRLTELFASSGTGKGSDSCDHGIWQVTQWKRSSSVGFAQDRIMLKFKLLQLPLFFLVLISQASAQFAHTDHKQIVDAGGKPLLLRATNLGNWLVPEGYMWLFPRWPAIS